MINDERVRYSPELGVWTLDLANMTSVSPGQADNILARAMYWARDAGSTLDGCTCDPMDQHMDGHRVRTASPTITHVVASPGDVLGRFVVYGHGGRIEHAGSVVRQEYQVRTCPLRNEAGEQRAKALVDQGNLSQLFELTESFPVGAGPLAALEPGLEAPEVWDGEPFRFSADGNLVRVPGRHLHPEARAALDAYQALALKAADLGRAAREAQTAHDNAPRDLRRQVKQAAISGQTPDSFDAAQTLRDLELAAQATRAVADGTADALSALRKSVVAAVEANRPEWLAYLGGQGSAALGRYQAALAALDEATADLIMVDAMRANVERPTTPGHQPFSQGSSLAAKSPAGAAREFASLAAEALAPLSRHVQAASTVQEAEGTPTKKVGKARSAA